MIPKEVHILTVCMTDEYSLINNCFAEEEIYDFFSWIISAQTVCN